MAAEINLEGALSELFGQELPDLECAGKDIPISLTLDYTNYKAQLLIQVNLYERSLRSDPDRKSLAEIAKGLQHVDKGIARLRQRGHKINERSIKFNSCEDDFSDNYVGCLYETPPFTSQKSLVKFCKDLKDLLELKVQK